MSTRAAVFLDRDGTIIEDTGYIADPDAVRLLPGAATAIGRLNRADLHLDVMIGTDDFEATAWTADGRRVALLTDGTWQL